ncbi:MAG: hypothetical protein IPM48_12410 [Saprospiraceae bacterium]|nr:hypothetical protein [Saprospiraceae bacterium]
MILYFLLHFSFLFTHPHFVSVSNFKYIAVDSVLQVTHRVFTDDLERALSFHQGTKTDLLQDSLYSDNIQLLGQYLELTSNVYINNTKINLRLLGFEQDEEAVLIYREGKCDSPQMIKIKLDFLHSIIPSQVNIVHFNMDKVRKSTQLTKSKSEIQWILDK